MTTWIVMGFISLIYFLAGAAIPSLFRKKLTAIIGSIIMVEMMMLLWLIPALYVLAAIKNW
jgi:hypothetical protein